MAIAAADLTLGDLALERGERDVEHHLADLTALDADMVELEHEHVALAAIDAFRTREDRVDEVEIATDGRREAAAGIVHVPGQPRPPGAPSSHPPMAVRATNLALRDLGLDAGPLSRTGHERADELALLAHVIEVEHRGVALAAVDAWMLGKEVGHLLARRLDPLPPSRGDLADVGLAAAAEVVAEAFTAPVLQTGTGAIEG